eukprot:TRINITY_DN3754_c0_g1_i1.p1 TRINITY_DN3754_c0_g1~~TRINITY_DN3754_c0_g1_i1.p1  ORF type:complete len:402 (-),score=57.37 TRINITY_DN3754_c0_g1_i1:100-1305(-)
MSDLACHQTVNLFHRVASYPVVQKFCSSAKVYYYSAKETNPIIRYGLEQAETKLHEIAEVSKPVLKKLEEPQYQRYIQDADSFGCRQLDFLENQLSMMNNMYSSSLEAIDKKFVEPITSTKEQILNTGSNTVDVVKMALQTKVVEPVVCKKELLKGTLLEYLTATEKIVAEGLPDEERTNPLDETQTWYDRVRTLGNRVSKKLQKEAYGQLQNLKPRSPESLREIVHVNLIEYADKYIDGAEERRILRGGFTLFQTLNSQVSKRCNQMAETLSSASEWMQGLLNHPPSTVPWNGLVPADDARMGPVNMIYLNSPPPFLYNFNLNINFNLPLRKANFLSLVDLVSFLLHVDNRERRPLFDTNLYGANFVQPGTPRVYFNDELEETKFDDMEMTLSFSVCTLF